MKYTFSDQPHFVKTMAATLIFMLCWQEAFFAAPQAIRAPAIGSKTADLSLSDIVRDPSRLQVDFDASVIRETHAGTNGRLIIHIQDAHSNYDGQKNMAGILDGLMMRYGIRLVLAEGGEGDVSLDRIQLQMPETDLRQAANKLLMDGMIGGHEYLSLTGKKSFKMIGVEDQRLYNHDLWAYAALVEKRKKLSAHLRALRVAIERIKNRLYPKELLEYESLSQKVDGVDSSSRLWKLLELSGIPENEVGAYGEILKLRAIRGREEALDFGQAGREEEELMRETAAVDPRVPSEYARLFRVGYPSSEGAKGQQLEWIFKKAKSYGIDIAKYTHLRRYGDYLRAFLGLDMPRLLQESAQLEHKVYGRILGGGDEGVLRGLDRYVQLLDKACDLRMSSEEFRTLKFNERSISTDALQAFLNRKLSELGYWEDLIPSEGRIEDIRGSIHHFYSIVDQRDDAFLRNTDKLLAHENERAAFLVTGGYHTTHLTALLRERGYSYVVIAPHVKSETDHPRYEKTLLAPVRRARRERAAKEIKNSVRTAQMARPAETLVAALAATANARARWNEYLETLDSDRSAVRLVKLIQNVHSPSVSPAPALPLNNLRHRAFDDAPFSEAIAGARLGRLFGWNQDPAAWIAGYMEDAEKAYYAEAARIRTQWPQDAVSRLRRLERSYHRALARAKLLRKKLKSEDRALTGILDSYVMALKIFHHQMIRLHAAFGYLEHFVEDGVAPSDPKSHRAVAEYTYELIGKEPALQSIISTLSALRIDLHHIDAVMENVMKHKQIADASGAVRVIAVLDAHIRQLETERFGKYEKFDSMRRDIQAHIEAMLRADLKDVILFRERIYSGVLTEERNTSVLRDLFLRAFYEDGVVPPGESESLVNDTIDTWMADALARRSIRDEDPMRAVRTGQIMLGFDSHSDRVQRVMRWAGRSWIGLKHREMAWGVLRAAFLATAIIPVLLFALTVQMFSQNRAPPDTGTVPRETVISQREEPVVQESSEDLWIKFGETLGKLEVRLREASKAPDTPETQAQDARREELRQEIARRDQEIQTLDSQKRELLTQKPPPAEILSELAALSKNGGEIKQEIQPEPERPDRDQLNDLSSREKPNSAEGPGPKLPVVSDGKQGVEGFGFETQNVWVATLIGPPIDAPTDGDQYLSFGGYGLFNPLDGTYSMRPSQTEPWLFGKPGELHYRGEATHEILTSLESLNRWRNVTENSYPLPIVPGFVPCFIKASDSDAYVIYDPIQQNWRIVGTIRGNFYIGIRPARKGELGAMPVTQIHPDAIRADWRSHIPPVIREILDYANTLPPHERLEFKNEILRRMFYTQNPRLMSALNKEPIFIDGLFAGEYPFAGWCERFALANFILSHELGLPRQIMSGIVDFVPHKGHFSTKHTHLFLWCEEELSPEEMGIAEALGATLQIDEATALSAHGSDLHRKSPTARDWEDEMEHLANRKRYVQDQLIRIRDAAKTRSEAHRLEKERDGLESELAAPSAQGVQTERRKEVDGAKAELQALVAVLETGVLEPKAATALAEGISKKWEVIQRENHFEIVTTVGPYFLVILDRLSEMHPHFGAGSGLGIEDLKIRIYRTLREYAAATDWYDLGRDSGDLAGTAYIRDLWTSPLPHWARAVRMNGVLSDAGALELYQRILDTRVLDMGMHPHSPHSLIVRRNSFDHAGDFTVERADPAGGIDGEMTIPLTPWSQLRSTVDLVTGERIEIPKGQVTQAVGRGVSVVSMGRNEFELAGEYIEPETGDVVSLDRLEGTTLPRAHRIVVHHPFFARGRWLSVEEHTGFTRMRGPLSKEVERRIEAAVTDSEHIASIHDVRFAADGTYLVHLTVYDDKVDPAGIGDLPDHRRTRPLVVGTVDGVAGLDVSAYAQLRFMGLSPSGFWAFECDLEDVSNRAHLRGTFPGMDQFKDTEFDALDIESPAMHYDREGNWAMQVVIDGQNRLIGYVKGFGSFNIPTVLDPTDAWITSDNRFAVKFKGLDGITRLVGSFENLDSSRIYSSDVRFHHSSDGHWLAVGIEKSSGQYTAQGNVSRIDQPDVARKIWDAKQFFIKGPFWLAVGDKNSPQKPSFEGNASGMEGSGSSDGKSWVSVSDTDQVNRVELARNGMWAAVMHSNLRGDYIVGQFLNQQNLGDIDAFTIPKIIISDDGHLGAVVYPRNHDGAELVGDYPGFEEYAGRRFHSVWSLQEHNGLWVAVVKFEDGTWGFVGTLAEKMGYTHKRFENMFKMGMIFPDKLHVLPDGSFFLYSLERKEFIGPATDRLGWANVQISPKPADQIPPEMFFYSGPTVEGLPHSREVHFAEVHSSHILIRADPATTQSSGVAVALSYPHERLLPLALQNHVVDPEITDDIPREHYDARFAHVNDLADAGNTEAAVRALEGLMRDLDERGRSGMSADYFTHEDAVAVLAAHADVVGQLSADAIAVAIQMIKHSAEEAVVIDILDAAEERKRAEVFAGQVLDVSDLKRIVQRYQDRLFEKHALSHLSGSGVFLPEFLYDETDRQKVRDWNAFLRAKLSDTEKSFLDQALREAGPLYDLVAKALSGMESEPFAYADAEPGLVFVKERGGYSGLYFEVELDRGRMGASDEVYLDATDRLRGMWDIFKIGSGEIGREQVLQRDRDEEEIDRILGGVVGGDRAPEDALIGMIQEIGDNWLLLTFLIALLHFALTPALEYLRKKDMDLPFAGTNAERSVRNAWQNNPWFTDTDLLAAEARKVLNDPTGEKIDEAFEKLGPQKGAIFLALVVLSTTQPPQEEGQRQGWSRLWHLAKLAPFAILLFDFRTPKIKLDIFNTTAHNDMMEMRQDMESLITSVKKTDSFEDFFAKMLEILRDTAQAHQVSSTGAGGMVRSGWSRIKSLIDEAEQRTQSQKWVIVPRPKPADRASGEVSGKQIGAGAPDSENQWPYVPGDDIRRINWRHWMKTDRVFVSRPSSEKESAASIIVDLRVVTDPAAPETWAEEINRSLRSIFERGNLFDRILFIMPDGRVAQDSIRKKKGWQGIVEAALRRRVDDATGPLGLQSASPVDPRRTFYSDQRNDAYEPVMDAVLRHAMEHSGLFNDPVSELSRALEGMRGQDIFLVGVDAEVMKPLVRPGRNILQWEGNMALPVEAAGSRLTGPRVTEDSEVLQGRHFGQVPHREPVDELLPKGSRLPTLLDSLQGYEPDDLTSAALGRLIAARGSVGGRFALPAGMGRFLFFSISPSHASAALGGRERRFDLGMFARSGSEAISAMVPASAPMTFGSDDRGDAELSDLFREAAGALGFQVGYVNFEMDLETLFGHLDGGHKEKALARAHTVFAKIKSEGIGGFVFLNGSGEKYGFADDPVVASAPIYRFWELQEKPQLLGAGVKGNRPFAAGKKDETVPLEFSLVSTSMIAYLDLDQMDPNQKMQAYALLRRLGGGTTLPYDQRIPWLQRRVAGLRFFEPSLDYEDVAIRPLSLRNLINLTIFLEELTRKTSGIAA